MSQSTEQRAVAELLEAAGIAINGDRPFDIQVRQQDFFARLVTGGSMALGESYMDGWWYCDALDQFFEKVLAARLDQKARYSKSFWLSTIKLKMTGHHSRKRAYEIGAHHYDPTLMSWHDNVTPHWSRLRDKYDDRFYRMWTYYLLASAGAFRARRNQLWQIVFSKDGVRGGYQPVRL